ncbi:MAG: hypothetical protein SF052_10230 [Bacteroidia bacterium]|nr:hypothetical protein [Bacteroidia bacterium]
MKAFKILLLMKMLCLLIAGTVFSQTSPSGMLTASEEYIDKSFIFVAEAQVVEYDLLNQNFREDSRAIAQRGDIFQVIGTATIEENIWYVFRFYRTGKVSKGGASAQENETPVFYGVRMLDFQAKTRAYNKISSVSFGAIMVPVKFRFPNKEAASFDLSKDVAIGTSIGYKQGLSRFKPYFINFLFATGVSSISAFPENTGGAVASTTDVAGLTTSLGLILEMDKIQLGVFSGIDMVPKAPGKVWTYQGAPWLSMGIGFQMLSWNAGL